jgi:hypothetical protein
MGFVKIVVLTGASHFWCQDEIELCCYARTSQFSRFALFENGLVRSR